MQIIEPQTGVFLLLINKNVYLLKCYLLILIHNKIFICIKTTIRIKNVTPVMIEKYIDITASIMYNLYNVIYKLFVIMMNIYTCHTF